MNVLVSSGPAWAASAWALHVSAVNSGEAQAQALPTAPSATSACSSPASARTVKVGWAAVTHASAYGIYQSSSTVGGSYTLQATVSTTSWTSAVLVTGHYWYEVVADIGSSWVSARSAATAERTITSLACS